MFSGWKKKALSFLCMFYLLTTAAFTQQVDSLQIIQENALLQSYDSIMAEGLFKRYDRAEKFYSSFCTVLEKESDLDYPYDQLKNIGKIYSSDKQFRVITWNIPVGYNDNLYFGIVQFYSRREKTYKLVRLNDHISNGVNSKAEPWSGALYYSIVETKHAGQKYYTLLGFDMHNPLSNKKVIDVVSIDDFDEFYICEGLFSYQHKKPDRLSFEYNEKASMSLNYNEEKKMIVFDHLSPSRPSLKDKYEFYGPDFTYDGLKWEKGVWVHYSNIDVTN